MSVMSLPPKHFKACSFNLFHIFRSERNNFLEKNQFLTKNSYDQLFLNLMHQNSMCYVEAYKEKIDEYTKETFQILEYDFKMQRESRLTKIELVKALHAIRYNIEEESEEVLVLNNIIAQIEHELVLESSEYDTAKWCIE